jgi:hypothetical protein
MVCAATRERGTLAMCWGMRTYREEITQLDSLATPAPWASDGSYTAYVRAACLCARLRSAPSAR